MLAHIVAGFFCDPEEVAVVKTTGEDSCALFLRGQSAIDGGFTLDYDADEVAKAVNDACDELYATRDEGEGDGNKDANEEEEE